ncbi:hypothetical protein R5W24_003344 [Gemmata sp. JC717]|uniref:helix-turn-helix transcriptional regulator n=1 Tax=Gemmata algarum TaxID=2975278 RepID=UPI0021BB101E|nr:hypothetical protein [Gemmata algarum]MDY3554225.1 hypothetical protein [Gemmata algarum]
MTTSSCNAQPEKAAVSIKEMAGMCGLSRQRFGQLVKAGVFPAPLRDKESGRPYYPPELQVVCLKVRQKNHGVNGKIVMFYSVRTPIPLPTSRPKPAKPQGPTTDQQADLLDGLYGLGLTTATAAQVQEALAHLYPAGPAGTDSDQVLRGVFLYLRNKNSAEKVGRKE